MLLTGWKNGIYIIDLERSNHDVSGFSYRRDSSTHTGSSDILFSKFIVHTVENRSNTGLSKFKIFTQDTRATYWRTGFAAWRNVVMAPFCG
jgi:hypothetical protein